jgi:hypothetical protein
MIKMKNNNYITLKSIYQVILRKARDRADKIKTEKASRMIASYLYTH